MECVNLATLSVQEIEAIGASLAAQPTMSDAVVARFKQQYPGVSFTLCFESDMGSHDPYVEYEQFDLHLVAHSAQGGCSRVTTDLNACSGLVIALHEE
ncbi:hypothetical protein [Vibrio porteresiae]|uniref:Uncharacterized protein n=1 Tax=Vibrio porteresiae DSM 19223 TaxID=1123496 RepID=A0ABZ0QKF7_9VIBR|nr:hypothetical protein [Vibrio porteresiae]WPC76290.1 hypothetical protein R8Z52_17320 [Vibrio porteresiae DSM 19223]